MICRHPKLTEIDKITLMQYESTGQRGSVVGAFQWKKYYCKKCKCIVTILQAVVEKPK